MPDFDFARPAVETTPLPKQVLVYGAGSMGKRVAGTLKNQGIEPLALLDRQAAPGASWQGLPITTAEAWAHDRRDGCRAVVIGIHNPAHSVADLSANLRSLGFGPIVNMIDLCNLYPAQFDDCFWLAPRSAYQGHEEDVEALIGLLDDEKSRSLVHDVVRMRTQGDYGCAPRPEGGQYCPADLPRWPASLRLIDCGAYTGDTLAAFMAANYKIDAAICLEPDTANYEALTRTVRESRVNAMLLPCAASRTSDVLRFSAEGAGSSHVDARGNVTVQALGLDEAFPAFAPNLIKMDIEGAEPDALAGAVRTIADFRPGLAISVYHRADHLWSIALELRKYLDGYTFAMRAHSHNSFDIVLYARPAP